MTWPCRCVNCLKKATGEDGKCDICRERPEAYRACEFLSDTAYARVVSAHTNLGHL